jgi:hypothetical protein
VLQKYLKRVVKVPKDQSCSPFKGHFLSCQLGMTEILVGEVVEQVAGAPISETATVTGAVKKLKISAYQYLGQAQEPHDWIWRCLAKSHLRGSHDSHLIKYGRMDAPDPGWIKDCYDEGRSDVSKTIYMPSEG